MRAVARSFFTDNRGEFDSGRVIAPVAVISMIIISGIDVLINHQRFDAQGLGIGIASVLTGLGFYLWGDFKNAQIPVPTPVPTPGNQVPQEK